MKEQSAGLVKVAYVDGVRNIPLTAETMTTLSNFFVLKKGVYYFSPSKQKKFITKGLKKQ